MKKYCFLLTAMLACIAAAVMLFDKPPSVNPTGALLTDGTRAISSISSIGTLALAGEAPGLHTLSANVDADTTADTPIDGSLNLNKLTFTGLGI